MNKLDDEEKEILESFEKGELESVGDPNRLAQLQIDLCEKIAAYVVI